MGLVLAVFVHVANIHDSKAGIDIITMLRGRFSRLKKIVADGGYRGGLIDTVKERFSWVLEIVLRTDKKQNFTVLPKRWVVERTFAWFVSYRRLSKDYEYNTDTSEAMIQLAMVRLMLNRISK